MHSEDVGPPGPEDGDRGRDSQTSTPITQNQPDHESSYNEVITSSRQVAWWDVHLWRDRMLESLGVQSFPMVGTPAWTALPDENPVKLAAAIDASQHWALRVDTCQEQLAAAAQTISASEDWTAIARASRDRADFIAANPWAKRVAS